MRVSSERTHWLKGLVGFALDGDVSEEIARQEGALASDPGSAKPHFNLGVLHHMVGPTVSWVRFTLVLGITDRRGDMLSRQLTLAMRHFWKPFAGIQPCRHSLMSRFWNPW
jgi:hypothetical protein